MVANGEESTVRRPAVVTVALVLLLVAVFGGAPGLRGAQDATPAATPDAGVTTERHGEGLPQGEGFPYTLWLSRTTFGPGASAALADIENPDLGYTGAIVAYVESGSLLVTVEGGTVLVPAAIGDEEATPSAAPFGVGSPVAPGTEIALAAGDSIFFESAQATLRNASDTEEAVLWNSVLADETRRCPPCPTFP